MQVKSIHFLLSFILHRVVGDLKLITELNGGSLHPDQVTCTETTHIHIHIFGNLE